MRCCSRDWVEVRLASVDFAQVAAGDGGDHRQQLTLTLLEEANRTRTLALTWRSNSTWAPAIRRGTGPLQRRSGRSYLDERAAHDADDRGAARIPCAPAAGS